MNKNIHIYSIGYSSYEECPYTYLFTTKFYSKEEFEQLCIEVSAKIVKSKDSMVSFQDIYPEVVQELISNYNFTEITSISSFMPFGWANIQDKNDWSGNRGELLDLIAKRSVEL